MQTRHVVLVTYGEPPTPAFMDHLVYSWRILLGLTRSIAMIPKPALPMIALSRARLRNRMWTDERYGSPLETITGRQADDLHAALIARDPIADWRVTVAYEFRQPLLRDVLSDIPADEPVVVAPMYAAESGFTHALSRAVAADLGHVRPSAGSTQVLGAFDARELGRIMGEYVRETVHKREGWSGDDVALVLAAHGTLLEPERPIDTGLAATEALCDAIQSELDPDFGLIVNGWLNHTKGGRWTEPAIELALHEVADAGFKRVVYFPYGFLADNAETELEGRLALRTQPDLDAWHLPCLNTSAPLIDLLAGAVVGASAL